VTHERPRGVAWVAAAFLLAAAYLLVVGLTMLVRPGLVSMAAGAEFLGGLELAGPYMFILVAAIGLATAFGLWRLQNWARWIAILLAMVGVLLLLPNVSNAILDFRFGTLSWSALGTIVRVIIVWYLNQLPVKEAFQNR